MGYCMKAKKIEFFIAADEKGAALKRVKEMLQGKETIKGYGQPYYRWMNDSNWAECKTLEECLEEWRWHAKVDEEGNIVGLEFEGEKLGDDLRFFGALAKHVKDGSYIRMLGEDGHQWKWVFKNGEVNELPGKVSFE